MKVDKLLIHLVLIVTLINKVSKDISFIFILQTILHYKNKKLFFKDFLYAFYNLEKSF